MVRHGPSLVLALSSAFALTVACGADDGRDEGRKEGAEGIADAFHDYAEFQCECVADQNGGSSQVEELCLDTIGDPDDHFPLSCIEGVIERHPEARDAFDCAAEVTYEYVDCLVDDGCVTEPSEACEAILQDAATGCPQPPASVEADIEACFPTFVCADGSELPEGWVCDGASDCSGGEDEAVCARSADRRERLKPAATATSTKAHAVVRSLDAALAQAHPVGSSGPGTSPGSFPVASPSTAAVLDASSLSVAAPVPVAAPTPPAVPPVSSLPPEPSPTTACTS